MMKLILVAALVAVAAADVSHLPQFHRQPQPLIFRPTSAPVHHVPVGRSGDSEIPVYRNEISPDGSYDWAYQTANGIAAQESAQIRAISAEEADKTAQGSFSWTSPEGVPVAIQYVADANGYQPRGDALPVDHPVPAYIQRALDWIAAHPAQPEQPARRFQVA